MNYFSDIWRLFWKILVGKDKSFNWVFNFIDLVWQFLLSINFNIINFKLKPFLTLLYPETLSSKEFLSWSVKITKSSNCFGNLHFNFILDKCRIRLTIQLLSYSVKFIQKPTDNRKTFRIKLLCIRKKKVKKILSPKMRS
jgi:hypothetical protein